MINKRRNQKNDQKTIKLREKQSQGDREKGGQERKVEGEENVGFY